MVIERWALLYEGKLLGFSTTCVEEASNSVDVEFNLDKWEDNVWTSTNYDRAVEVSKTDTPWYNRDFDHPGNSYVGKCKVVAVTLIYEE